MKSNRSALSRSLSAEVAIHTVIIVFVYLPILVILFPAALILTGTTIALSDFPSSALAAWLTGSSFGPAVFGILLTLIVAAIGTALHFRRNKSDELKLKPLEGKPGAALEKLVVEIWGKISNEPAPNIRWFAAFDIAGYAASPGGKPELHLSAGLWQKAIAGEKTAIAILAHELAHIRNNDPRLLKTLDFVRVSAASALIFATAIGVAVFCLVLASEARTAFLENGVGAMIFRALLVLVGTIMIISLFPLSWMALRRHIGFIHSLLELRADMGVSDLLCMSKLAHASLTKEHEDNDDIQGSIRRAA